jgi:nitrogen fixation NifU-like protein
MDDLYQEHILDHYQHPRHYGKLSGDKQSSDLANLSCGDGISVDVQLDDAGKIADVAWEGSGCAISMASASVISEWAIGKTLPEVQALTIEDISQKLGLKQISHSRIKCAYLFVHALQKVNGPTKI